ncbi:MAG: prephenate dehydrogenase [Clostridia bacterium]|nr:prephenate dehydrogenase [Clostridia bacterium]
MLDKTKRFMIVGLGLIGGSYAKGLRHFGFRVTAIDRDPHAIEYALQNGIIDEGWTETNAEALADADVIVFALYPKVFLEWVKENGASLKKGTLLTDVTGVKSCIVKDIQDALPEGVEFISAHPMAGREVSGVENSDPAIFRGANYIVVPTEQNSEEAIESCKELGMLLGFAQISVLSPEEHDEMIGFLSQLTHCIAVSLMTCSDNTHLACYTGDSFRDLTRIARINDAMWSELFLLNRDALLAQMDKFLLELYRMRYMLEVGDVEGLREKMRLSTERRAVFDKKIK